MRCYSCIYYVEIIQIEDGLGVTRRICRKTRRHELSADQTKYGCNDYCKHAKKKKEEEDQ